MLGREPRGPEGHTGRSWARSKFGLETPLVGRFWGENKRLVFAPPLWYDWLVLACVVGGFGAFLGGFLGFSDGYWGNVGAFVGFAGVWGALSSERMTIDLRQRTYWRREGQGPFKRMTRGSLDQIDAVVSQAHEFPVPTLGGRLVIYRTVLFWKGAREPLFVAERKEATIPYGAPINAGAHHVLAKGARYAQEMKLPFYDNTHFHTADPILPF
ncbi:MAG: hypothetical protein KF857_01255 [Fimbriimonadaceae bacterium]|nr:hypothetical protein [Fimbriimonadaceae bacterium]